jgi:hypothetical protein
MCPCLPRSQKQNSRFLELGLMRKAYGKLAKTNSLNYDKMFKHIIMEDKGQ